MKARSLPRECFQDTVAAMSKAAILLLLGLSGCVVVKPYQRGYFAKKAMISAKDSGERRFEQHQTGSREGADGGTGEPSGGCGCN